MMGKAYIFDRVLHWLSAALLLFMLMNLSSQLHNVDWDIKGQVVHRQDAVEIHATIGLILLIVTLARIFYSMFNKAALPRIQPKGPKHAAFIKVIHLALYFCILGLVVTGLVMFNNYEIPLSLFGIELQPSKQDFYSIFPDIHRIHMLLRNTIWWLIGIHFVGIMYAKK